MSRPPLYCRITGQGNPVVLLHGWGMNLRVFDALRAALCAHHTVHALDLPGHGRSPWHTGLSAEEQLEWLAAHVPPGATLVGWSLGGQLAMQLAADAAVQAQRLVLIASTPRFTRAPDWPAALRPSTLPEFAGQLERDEAATLLRFLQMQVHGSAQADATYDALREALDSHGQAHPEALALGLTLLQQNDLRGLAARLPLPVLLIAGVRDCITPIGASRALARLLADVQQLELPQAGHAPFISHLNELRAPLLAFLAGQARPAGVRLARHG